MRTLSTISAGFPEVEELVEPLKIALDMRPQQLLHAVVGELRFEFGNRALWIA
jgi:hypothetical protein